MKIISVKTPSGSIIDFKLLQNGIRCQKCLKSFLNGGDKSCEGCGIKQFDLNKIIPPKEQFVTILHS